MEIKADEITAILKQQLAGYEKAIDVAEVGTVLSVGDGIARVYGLDKVMSGELVDFGHDIFGLALNLEQDQVGGEPLDHLGLGVEVVLGERDQQAEDQGDRGDDEGDLVPSALVGEDGGGNADRGRGVDHRTPSYGP